MVNERVYVSASSAFAQLLKDYYLPSVQRMLNRDILAAGLFRALAGFDAWKIRWESEYGLTVNVPGPISRALAELEKMMAVIASDSPFAPPAMETILQEYLAPVVANHRLKVWVTRRVESDSMAVGTRCEVCGASRMIEVGMVALFHGGGKAALEDILRQLAYDHFQPFECDPCLNDPEFVSVIAEWLTVKLHIRGTLTLGETEALLRFEHICWPIPTVEAVARLIGFTGPLVGLLRFPEEHPWAA